MLLLRLAGDASSYGVRAVILEDGPEQSITFASHTMSQSKQKYSQIEKDALSLISGVKFFSPMSMVINLLELWTTSPYPLYMDQNRELYLPLAYSVGVRAWHIMLKIQVIVLCFYAS